MQLNTARQHGRLHETSSDIDGAAAANAAMGEAPWVSSPPNHSPQRYEMKNTSFLQQAIESSKNRKENNKNQRNRWRGSTAQRVAKRASSRTHTTSGEVVLTCISPSNYLHRVYSREVEWNF